MSPKSFISAIATAFAFAAALPAVAQTAAGADVLLKRVYHVSDEELVKTLPGFKNSYITANGVRLHYVEGGTGTPLILLPGWPETWWAFEKIMPELAKKHHVLAVDFRGMGTSDKPQGGYDKKNMALDISEMVRQLGYTQVDIAGHDVGAMIAYSFAVNHPEQTRKLVMIDVAHPSQAFMHMTMIPQPGTLTDKMQFDYPYLWWFSFNQITGVTEELLTGHAEVQQNWVFHYMMLRDDVLDARDRAVFAKAYNSRDAVRASAGWFRAFEQDIKDDGTYGPLKMPVMGVAGSGYKRLKQSLDARAPGSQTYEIPNSGHFVAEEQPEALLQKLDEFLN